MKLIQRKLFYKKNITVEENRIKVRNENLNSSEEVTINLEELDITRMAYKKKTDNVMLIVTVIFGGFFLINVLNPNNYKSENDDPYGVFIFLFIVTLISGLFTYLNSKEIILIPTINNGYLEIFRAKPNKVEVDNFISKLSEQINLSLKNKYGKLDLDMPIEPQLMNISWLKDIGVISELEFEGMKSELIKVRRNQNTIGFKN